MGNSLPKMSVRTRIALVPVVAAALCLLAVSANQDMDERAVIADLVKEAAGAYTTAASAAVTALAEAEKNQPSKEDKLQECICAARGTAGDPCVEASMDDAAQKKMREEFANSCNQELAQMPGSMKETILAECVKRRTESAGLKFEVRLSLFFRNLLFSRDSHMSGHIASSHQSLAPGQNSQCCFF